MAFNKKPTFDYEPYRKLLNVMIDKALIMQESIL